VPEIGEYHIQVAVAVQIDRAGSVVIRTAAIDASDNIVIEQIDQTDAQQRQEQEKGPYLQGPNVGV
jgi:hypothetical protein